MMKTTLHHMTTFSNYRDIEQQHSVRPAWKKTKDLRPLVLAFTVRIQYLVSFPAQKRCWNNGMFRIKNNTLNSPQSK